MDSLEMKFPTLSRWEEEAKDLESVAELTTPLLEPRSPDFLPAVLKSIHICRNTKKQSDRIKHLIKLVRKQQEIIEKKDFALELAVKKFDAYSKEAFWNQIEAKYPARKPMERCKNWMVEALAIGSEDRVEEEKS